MSRNVVNGCFHNLFLNTCIRVNWLVSKSDIIESEFLLLRNIISKLTAGVNFKMLYVFLYGEFRRRKSSMKNSHCVKNVEIRRVFWSGFSFIQTKYGDLLRKSLFPVQIQENTNQKNSVFKHFSCSNIHNNNRFERKENILSELEIIVR